MATVRIRSSFLRVPPLGSRMPTMAAVGGPGAAAAPAPGSQRESQRMWRLRLLIAAAAVLATSGLAFWLDRAFPDSGFSAPLPAPIEGLTVFGIFYVTAQALERLLEPISRILLPKEKKSDDYAVKLDTAEKCLAVWSASPGDGTKLADAKTAAERALEEAAKAKAALQGRHGDRVVLFWFLATGVAVLASAVLHLYFLKAVGIASGSRWIEILATGLIIGSGTKPLHDLITLISSKAQTTQSPEEEQGGTTSSS
jgi:hypothetical protein